MTEAESQNIQFSEQLSFPCFDFINIWSISDEYNYPVLFSFFDVPVIISPNNKKCISDEIIHIEWTEVDEASAYHLQISSDPDFNTLVYDSENIPDTEMTINLIEYFESYHNYYIRVRAFANGIYYYWSDTHSFGIAYSIEGDLSVNL